MIEKKLQLPEIKHTAYSTLVFFDEYCKMHGLKYFLSNGTLLGAVKYCGFIPWDDDVDVLMPREDYDRFIKTYKDVKLYKLFSRERDPQYKYTYAKLCHMGTIKKECNIDNGVELGIDIDIFPLDYCSDHLLRNGMQRKMNIYQKACILSKFVSSKGKPLYKRLIIAVCKMLGFDFFCNRLSKLVKKESGKGTKYLGCLMWPIYGKKEIVPSQVFSDTIDVTFNDRTFPAPVGYHTYLQSLYGEYHLDPPLNKQKSHHLFEAYYK